MKEEIDNIIKNREWTFNDISNMNDTIDGIFTELKGQLTGSQKLELVWETDVEFTGNFGDCFNELLKVKLSAEIAERITSLLKEAKVVFGKEKKKPKVVPSEIKGSDTDSDDEVKTRVGTIKVNRA